MAGSLIAVTCLQNVLQALYPPNSAFHGQGLRIQELEFSLGLFRKSYGCVIIPFLRPLMSHVPCPHC